MLIFMSAAVAALSCGGKERSDEGSVVAFLGDSNLWIGGDDCSDSTAWTYRMLREIGAAKARSFARSGATITNTRLTPADTTHYTELLNDTNTFYNQALRLNGAIASGYFPRPSLIIIYGGSNDAWFASRRPELWDGDSDSDPEVTATTMPADATTLSRSLRLVAALLNVSNPEAEIVVVGPPFMTKTSRKTISAVTDIMEAEASRMGLRMVRLDNDSLINPDKEKIRFSLTRDGVHTNPDGARRLGSYVARQIGEAKNNNHTL